VGFLNARANNQTRNILIGWLSPGFYGQLGTIVIVWQRREGLRR